LKPPILSGFEGAQGTIRAFAPRIPTTVEGLVGNPGSLYGRSANEIADAFVEQGFGATVRQSTRGSQRAAIVSIEGHPEIAQIQVHPGGGDTLAPT